MGKATGFLEYERMNNIDVPVKERVKNFKEFHLSLSDKERMEREMYGLRGAFLSVCYEIKGHGNGLSLA